MKKMMKRNAFTVVELVIVIAVIAVLAAVMIPAFTGIMQSAHVSADTQKAAAMTTQITVTADEPIKTESQLKKALDAAYGDPNYFATLAPESASYGYHFWFDIENQKVVVAKPNELSDVAAAFALRGLPTWATFAPGSPRTAIKNGYYLMDRAGSEIAELISKVETTGEGFADLLAATSPYDGLASVANTLILTSRGPVGNASATVAYISPFVGAVGGSGIDAYTNITEISVPAGVIIKEGALRGNVNIIIDIDAALVDGKLPELEPYFADDGTKVTLKGEGDYVVENGMLKDQSTGNSVDLGYANPVTDFTITIDGTSPNPGTGPLYLDDNGTPTDKSDDVLYVAVTYLDAIQFKATDINADASSTLFTWTVSGGPFTVNETAGTLTRKPFAELGATDEVLVTATPRAGGDSKALTVRLVKPTGATFTLGGASMSSSTFTLNYDGTGGRGFAATTPAPSYNYPGFVAMEGLSFSFKQTDDAAQVFGVDAATGNISLPQSGSCTGTQAVTVTYGTATETYWTLDYTVKVTDVSGAAFERTDDYGVKVGEDYLFRVGNGNTVALKYLFENTDAPASITLSIFDRTAPKVNDDYPAIATSGSSGDFYATFNTTFAKDADSDGEADWDEQTIHFYGKGVARIEIKGAYGDTPCILYVEVVDGKNVTQYSELTHGNCVLLNNIKMPSNGSWYFTGATLHGNGFTFDVTDGAVSGLKGNATSNYLVGLTNATIDNVKLIGKVYSTFNIKAEDDYNRALVIMSGNSGIYNSHLSGCGSVVRTYAGTHTIDNTTLKGGTFANLDIRNGQITLRDVTTINQANLNDAAADGNKYIGLGIVTWYEQVLASTTITVEGTLTQYNHICQSDNIGTSNTTVKALFNQLFTNGDLAAYRHNGYLNAGIASMVSEVGKDNVLNASGTPASPSGYGTAIEITISDYTATVWPKTATADTLDDEPAEWKASKQNAMLPEATFDHTPNQKNKVDGSNDYCYYDEEAGVVYISMDEGDTFSWNAAILSVLKNGQTIGYTVKMNGTEYDAKQITFNTAGDYTVIFTYTDSLNYEKNGTDVRTYEKTYTKTVRINVSVVKPDAKNATFNFNDNGYREVAIGNITYVMPDVNATSATIGSKTVEGQTIYYPIVTAYTSNGADNTLTTCYMCFPVFNGVITITDYADGGAGDAVVYNGSTQSKPANLSVVTGEKPDGTPKTVGDVFIYASASPAANDPVVHNKVLVYQSPSLQGVNRNAQNVDVEYQYQDEKGTIYHYFVRYSCPKLSSTCVTSDTLVTLADGTQKRVDELTGSEMLLVWNHTTGALDMAPIAYIVDHGKTVTEQSILALTFSDGRVLEMIGEHVFYDKTLSKYVAITPDNVSEYIGHTFVANEGEGVAEILLVSAEEYKRETGIYEVVTYQNISCFTNGVLSASAYLDRVLNVFDIDADTMAYDAEQVAADIEEYGLYTYDDFAGLISEEAFDLYNAAYLKVAVGTGYITWDDILDLISIYFANDVTPLQ